MSYTLKNQLPYQYETWIDVFRVLKNNGLYDKHDQFSFSCMTPDRYDKFVLGSGWQDFIVDKQFLNARLFEALYPDLQELDFDFFYRVKQLLHRGQINQSGIPNFSIMEKVDQSFDNVLNLASINRKN